MWSGRPACCHPGITPLPSAMVRQAVKSVLCYSEEITSVPASCGRLERTTRLRADAAEECKMNFLVLCKKGGKRAFS